MTGIATPHRRRRSRALAKSSSSRRKSTGHVAIAAFVKSSSKPVPEREKVIAQVARAVHDFFLFRPAS